MKIEGRISILVNREHTTIEIEDNNANTRFLNIKLTPEQLSMCLSRQACVPCEIELRGIEKLGKMHENESFVFEIPEELYQYGVENKEERLRVLAQTKLTNGWIAEGYFRSQNSFFAKDGKHYARCIIRRWI